MHFKIKLILGLLIILFTSYSCSNSSDVTYAEQLQAEKTLIADFISRNNIEVVTSLPKTYPWPENLYYKSSTGLYFHLVNRGDSIFGTDTISVQSGDLVVTRYMQYTLDAVADTISSWNTVDYPYPTTFTYLNTAQVCLGWHEAVSYMKYMNSEAKIIVPSKLSFSTFSDNVTPLGFDLKIKIQQN